MGDRGRESGSELAVVTQLGKVERPQPPGTLSPEQAIVWVETVNSLPATWFPQETLPLLEMYCAHTAFAKELDMLTRELMQKDAYDVKELKTLRDMYEKETRAAVNYAGKLRFTLQSTYDKSKKKQQSNKKLWGG